MLGFALGLGFIGAIVMVIVTIPATRQGRGPWTWWARKRADRALRRAMRPVPTAEERYAKGLSWRRLVGVVLHALPRRRRKKAPSFVTPGAHLPGESAPACAADTAAERAAKAAAAAAEPPRPMREKVDEHEYVAQVEAQADLANDIVIMGQEAHPDARGHRGRPDRRRHR